MPEQPPIAPLLLDALAAARALSISVRSLHRLVTVGELRPLFIGRLTRYDARDLLTFIDRRRQAPPPVRPPIRKPAAVGATP